MNDRTLPLLGKTVGQMLGIVEDVALQNDLHPILAEHLHLSHFLLRRGGRHKNRSLDVEKVTSVGHTLGVISGTCTNDAPASLFFRQRGDFVVGTTNLVRADRLQIFSFEKNIRTVISGQPEILGERSGHGNALQAQPGLLHVRDLGEILNRAAIFSHCQVVTPLPFAPPSKVLKAVEVDRCALVAIHSWFPGETQLGFEGCLLQVSIETRLPLVFSR